MARVFRKTCHTTCYKFDTLWNPGDVYEGEDDPGKHFSDSGKVEIPPPPPTAGDDPRSNAELRTALLQEPFEFKAPTSWVRKKLWQKLHDFEVAYDRDALTNPETKPRIPRELRGKCGFVAKTLAGLGAHKRNCPTCQEEDQS